MKSSQNNIGGVNVNLFKTLKNGIIKDNPIFVQLIGMCSVLAVSNTVINSFAMGLSVTAVLIASNLVISALRNIIPSKIRIPAFIVVIATFVTIIEMFMQAYAPPIYEALGIFLPLIVVNCAILARAEAFAYKNPILPSILDGLGTGIGYTLGISALGVVRELFGAGTLLGMAVLPEAFKPIGLFAMPPGSFIVLGVLIALFNVAVKKQQVKQELYKAEMK